MNSEVHGLSGDLAFRSATKAQKKKLKQEKERQEQEAEELKQRILAKKLEEQKMKIQAIRNIEEENHDFQRQDTPYPTEPQHHKLLAAKAQKATKPDKKPNDFFKAFHMDLQEAEAQAEAKQSKTPKSDKKVKFNNDSRTDDRHVKFDAPVTEKERQNDLKAVKGKMTAREEELSKQLEQCQHELSKERAHHIGEKSKALMLQDELDEKNQELAELRQQLESGAASGTADAKLQAQLDMQVKINKNLATKVLTLERELAEARRKAA